MRARLLTALLLSAGLAFGGVYVAASLQLTTFEPDTVIRSDEVNGNFQALATAVEALQTRGVVSSLNQLQGDVTLVAGDNVAIGTSANGTLTISSTAQGSGGGDITGVTAGAGLSGGGATGDVALAVDLDAVQARIATGCPSGSAIRSVDASGAASCADVGAGLTLPYDATADGGTDAFTVRNGPGTAIAGVSTNGSGVSGTSTSGYGVYGEAYRGVGGVTSASGAAAGVYGRSDGTGPDSFGVYGYASQGDGSEGTAAGVAVEGRHALGNIGQLGTEFAGVSGEQASGTRGWLGTGTSGVVGTYPGGSTGRLGTAGAAVVGSASAGALAGDFRGDVTVQGDLRVNGALIHSGPPVMQPIAYGTVLVAGTSISSVHASSNASVTRNGTASFYTVSIAGVNYSNTGYLAFVTPIEGGTDTNPAIARTAAINGNLEIRITDYGGFQKNNSFHFLVYANQP